MPHQCFANRFSDEYPFLHRSIPGHMIFKIKYNCHLDFFGGIGWFLEDAQVPYRKWQNVYI